MGKNDKQDYAWSFIVTVTLGMLPQGEVLLQVLTNLDGDFHNFARFRGINWCKGIHNKGSLVKRIIGVSYTSGMSVLVAEVELVILVPIPVERPDNNIMERL